MPSNSRGSYRTTRQNMMRAFDRLPPDVRAELRDSIDNRAPQPLNTMRKRGLEDKALVGLVRCWNNDELLERENQRRAARGPYRGLTPDPDYKPKRRRRRS